MKQNRIRISKDASHRLKMLKGRTQLTPNLLCRMAFCHSIEDPRPPNPDQYDTEGQEFNRFTLTGELDPLFMALLRERCISDGLDPRDDATLHNTFRAHLNRGVISIFNRMKDLSDVYELVPQLTVRNGGTEVRADLP